MTYAQLLQKLFANQWRRIERDDRLQDIFPTQRREKGWELWERWEDQQVKILRLKFPYEEKNITTHVLPRAQLENLLLTNQTANLDDYIETTNQAPPTP